MYYKETLMGVYSMRLTDSEKKVLEDYAKTHGISMADALKNAFFDMLEDQYDIKAADEAYAAYLADPEKRKATEALHPLGLGKTEDISNTCVFLLSDASRWITGQNIIVDGGYTIK